MGEVSLGIGWIGGVDVVNIWGIRLRGRGCANGVADEFATFAPLARGDAASTGFVPFDSGDEGRRGE